MKTYLSSVVLAAVMLFGAAHTAGQEQYNTTARDGNETVTLVASTCDKWVTVTLDFKEATWTQTTIQVPSCYDWWTGARAAVGLGRADRTTAGQWQVDPATYEMAWRSSESADGNDADRDYPMMLTALNF